MSRTPAFKPSHLPPVKQESIGILADHPFPAHFVAYEVHPDEWDYAEVGKRVSQCFAYRIVEDSIPRQVDIYVRFLLDHAENGAIQ